jgi:hypothetical protein
MVWQRMLRIVRLKEAGQIAMVSELKSNELR